jgi:hypothetical protein
MINLILNFVHIFVFHSFTLGVPATAASGAITANNLLSVQQHWSMLDKITLPDRK